MLKTPSIEVIDRTSIELTSSHTETGLVEATSVPRRFRAVFAGDRSTSIEIEMVDGRPLVRAYSVATDSEDLAARPLRPALNGQLVPAAVRAACYTNIRRDMPVGAPPPRTPTAHERRTGPAGGSSCVPEGGVTTKGRHEPQHVEVDR